MKNYAKIGNRKGKTAYRTPSSFKYRKYLKTIQAKRGTKILNKIQ